MTWFMRKEKMANTEQRYGVEENAADKSAEQSIGMPREHGDY